jgi:hypothetical protein
MRWISRDQLKREVSSKDHDLLDEVVERILGKVTAVTDFDIELQIHDLLLKNVEYVNKEKRSEHTIEGPLLNKKAVCEGIAKTTKYLLNKKGVGCEIVIGKMGEDDDVYHAWNIVSVDGIWYHLDVTADINMSDDGNFRYDYFNLSDKEISADHIILQCPTKCTISGQGYYHRMGLVINTQNDFRKMLTKAIGEGKREITFKIPSAKDPMTVSDKIMSNVELALSSVRHGFRRYRIKSNTDQLVFTVILS